MKLLPHPVVVDVEAEAPLRGVAVGPKREGHRLQCARYAHEHRAGVVERVVPARVFFTGKKNSAPANKCDISEISDKIQTNSIFLKKIWQNFSKTYP